jgi:ATP-dependent DNA ligase
VHWVRPELVAEVKFLTWTDDNLLGQVGRAPVSAGTIFGS